MKFLSDKGPTVVGMIKASSVANIIKEAEELVSEGAEALGLQMECLPDECITDEALKEIIDSLGERPLYITNYRRQNVRTPVPSEDELKDRLLSALSLGAALIDVRADMYCPETDEFTYEPEAVRKQMELIDTVHARGGEVLMSAHIFHSVPEDEIMKMAKEMHRRGADIAKIVSFAENEEELSLAFRITERLKRELPIPALFLINGPLCREHRYEAPKIERSLFLAVANRRANPTQPTVKEAVKIKASIV